MLLAQHSSYIPLPLPVLFLCVTHLNHTTHTRVSISIQAEWFFNQGRFSNHNICLVYVWNIKLSMHQHYKAKTKWPPFSRRHIQIRFLWNEKYTIFIQISRRSLLRVKSTFVQIMIFNEQEIIHEWWLIFLTHMHFVRPVGLTSYNIESNMSMIKICYD